MSIKVYAERYNEFQHQLGQGVEQDYEAIITELFSPEFKKTANGDVLVSNRSQLFSQCENCREMAGKWTIQSTDIIPSADNTQCTIRYLLTSEKAGQFDVIAIMTISNGLIDRVDEVYYQPESENNGYI
ncbi:MAG: hypothetical protein K2X50_01845 [Gammaproteobacteria bacterium]|nr:hypothetical protein [Gammaproteobacteria bacterium]